MAAAFYWLLLGDSRRPWPASNRSKRR
uniref:Uncharacterized protein n=1 Tax=Arundo donax TaxID=35708 RepID=A0A0A9A322_ARUDO